MTDPVQTHLLLDPVRLALTTTRLARRESHRAPSLPSTGNPASGGCTGILALETHDADGMGE